MVVLKAGKLVRYPPSSPWLAQAFRNLCIPIWRAHRNC
jgi:hypothetical protein